MPTAPEHDHTAVKLASLSLPPLPLSLPSHYPFPPSLSFLSLSLPLSLPYLPPSLPSLPPSLSSLSLSLPSLPSLPPSLSPFPLSLPYLPPSPPSLSLVYMYTLLHSYIIFSVATLQSVSRPHSSVYRGMQTRTTIYPIYGACFRTANYT